MIKSEKPRLLSMNRGHPIFLDSVNKVLLPVFKCGYTSSHAAYSPMGKTLASFHDLIDYKDVEKLALVRNPYARIASLWTCQNNRNHLHTYSRNFDQFVDNVAILLKDGYTDGHYNTLIANLSIKGEFIPDSVSKLEDLQGLINYIGIDVQFPKKNTSDNKKPFQSYYTEHSKQVVAELYKEDLEKFNYTFEE